MGRGREESCRNIEKGKKNCYEKLITYLQLRFCVCLMEDLVKWGFLQGTDLVMGGWKVIVFLLG